jgi:RNA polymerase sigma-70 factor (sigma-E family)
MVVSVSREAGPDRSRGEPPTRDEFELFVLSRGPSLLRSACLLTGDRHLAEDLVQSALAQCHRSWRRLRDPGNAEAYTRRVMYHLQVSWWRRRRVAESLTAQPPDHPRDDSAGTSEAWLTLRPALMKLAPRQRAVLVLRYFEDRTEAQTAEMLGVTVGTVKSQTAKGLARLRELMPNHEGTPR